MKTILEIFYLRIVDKKVHYQRKEADLSKKGGDPNSVIASLIQEKRTTSSGKVEEKEFLIHSTSWRYTKPDKIMLTYVAYSDELQFKPGKSQGFSLENLSKIAKSSRKPRSRTGLERKVVSHAIRHIAFLIKTDSQNELKAALKPETKRVFKLLWANLAGRVF